MGFILFLIKAMLTKSPFLLMHFFHSSWTRCLASVILGRRRINFDAPLLLFFPPNPSFFLGPRHYNQASMLAIPITTRDIIIYKTSIQAMRLSLSLFIAFGMHAETLPHWTPPPPLPLPPRSFYVCLFFAQFLSSRGKKLWILSANSTDFIRFFFELINWIALFIPSNFNFYFSDMSVLLLLLSSLLFLFHSAYWLILFWFYSLIGS